MKINVRVSVRNIHSLNFNFVFREKEDREKQARSNRSFDNRVNELIIGPKRMLTMRHQGVCNSRNSYKPNGVSVGSQLD